MPCTTGCRATGRAFLYPALAILAADAFGADAGWRALVLAPGRAGGGRCCCLLAYAAGADRVHSAASAIPWRGCWAWACKPMRRQVAADARRAAGATRVLTTDYETTAWLRFYAARISR